MSYEDLLEKCCILELTTRRDHLSLGFLHKIIDGECILYQMLLSQCTLSPTPLALMKLIGICLAFCAYQLAPGLIFSSCNLIVELSSCISNYHHIPTLLQKAVNTYSLILNLFVCHLHHNNNYYHTLTGTYIILVFFALIYVSFAYLRINYQIADLSKSSMCLFTMEFGRTDDSYSLDPISLTEDGVCEQDYVKRRTLG